METPSNTKDISVSMAGTGIKTAVDNSRNKVPRRLLNG